MKFFANLSATLLTAGISGIIVDEFYGVIAGMAGGAIFAVLLILILALDDAKVALAGGVVGLIIMAIFYIVDPISLIIVAAFSMILIPLDRFL